MSLEKEGFLMNKKMILAVILCLLLSFSLSVVPAFADGTVIVIGGALNPDTGSAVVTRNSAGSAAVISGSGSPVVTYDSAAASAAFSGGGANTVIVRGKDAAPSQTSSTETTMAGSVVVMPNGTVQTVSATPTPQAQTQAASAQTSAAAPVVVTQQAQTAAAQTAAAPLEAPAGLAKDIVDQINDLTECKNLTHLFIFGVIVE